MAKTQAINLDFSRGMVKSGIKVSESSEPEISLESSYCKFSLNTAGLRAINASAGDRVVMFDMQEFCEGDQQKRFYIAKIDYKIGKTPLGAIIGKNKTFNFSGVYNSILANDPEKKGSIQRELMDMGLLAGVRYPDDTIKYIALRKGVGSLESIGERTINLKDLYDVDDDITVEIFSITNIKFVDHEPQTSHDVFYDFAELHSKSAVVESIDAGAGDDDDDDIDLPEEA
jgi:hypothetical protein